ncbi:pyridoxamine 5'-phosphate oxidase family protein [Microvirga terrestris]|uniref:Pyridoxamine 5'-phosphate oxidase family protein n=1 Tax=Microvirga terrestris TaxID=2791024 RepID=A0ABS0HTY7_9HYPH|nr:pyridoxamine 5'-phosphate oxidase family protein [Microvirga terrestris]
MDQALRENILSILSSADDLTIATLRDDGYPQAPTVSFAHEDLFIYFGCSSVSKKACNIARDNRISLTINLPTTIGARSGDFRLPDERYGSKARSNASEQAEFSYKNSPRLLRSMYRTGWRALHSSASSPRSSPFSIAARASVTVIP